MSLLTPVRKIPLKEGFDCCSSLPVGYDLLSDVVQRVQKEALDFAALVENIFGELLDLVHLLGLELERLGQLVNLGSA